MQNSYRSRDPSLQVLGLVLSGDPRRNHNPKRHGVDITEELCEQTLRWCKRAGLAGTIFLKMLGVFGNRTGRIGHSVRAPTPHGVPVYWNTGKRRHISMMLNCPGVAGDELYARLKNALSAEDELLQRKEEAMTSVQIPAGDPADAALAKILDEGDEGKESEPANAASADSSGDSDPTSAANVDESQSETAYAQFMKDAENIELFLMELVKEVDPLGQISTAEAVEILHTQFGFPYVPAENRSLYSMPYNALSKLAKKGVLEKLTYGYRIPWTKFRELKPTKPTSEGAPTAEAETPVQSATEERPVTESGEVAAASEAVQSAPTEAVIESATTAEPASTPAVTLDALKHLEQIVAFVEGVRRKRAQAAAISVERDRLQAEIDELTARRKGLLDDLASISVALDDPQIAEAESLYDALAARIRSE